MPDFNRIASFYDLLKKIVFQSSLDKASFSFLEDIPENSQILILGGGSGALLSYLKKSQKVIYIEKSSAMIELAAKRKFNCSVEFVEADIMEYKFNANFDAVITPFILDCFSVTSLLVLMDELKHQLKNNGLWLQADFYPQNKFHKFFIKVMYVFFWISAGLRIKAVPDFEKHFKKGELQLIKKVSFKRGFIQSRLYRKIA